MKFGLVGFLALVLVSEISGIYVPKTTSEKASCGYDSCNPTKPDVINVHLVPHSHDDVGWLKTVDQYFTGTNRANWEWENQKPGVQYVLDSVVKELAFYPEKKYIQVETAFFWRWWLEQNEQMRNMTQSLVDNGQLEFVSGGWSMNDEGAAHYTAIIDQMSWGVRHLHSALGDCARPRVAWQIDPFGHAKEQANIFALMGFDGYFLGRLDYMDKAKREKDKTMEMVWHAQEANGEDSDIFTGINYNGYSPPDGFCWDIYCNDEPFMDNPLLKDYNADRRTQEFLDWIQDQAKVYQTKQLKVEMGMDFHYQSAISWYKNMDKLIKYVNERDEGVHVMYSTPSCYLKALHDEDIGWPEKTDDFFPYASDPNAYWTGYLSSRSTSKYLMRSTNQILQASKQMSATVVNQGQDTAEMRSALEYLTNSVAICQHHDAITGTEKQYVADDYHDRLTAGTAMFMEESVGQNDFSFCPLLNVTQCPIVEESAKFVINAYNPLARKQSRFIRVPVKSEFWSVTNEEGQTVPCQTVPIPQEVLSMPGQVTKATFELVFKALDLPPLGGAFFQATETPSHQGSKSQITHLPPSESFVIQSQHHRVSLGGSAGLTLEKIGTTSNVTFNDGFMWYVGHRGDNLVGGGEWDRRASGAYIFRPDGQEATPLEATGEPMVVEGPIVTEIRQNFGPWASKIQRVYNEESSFDFEVEWMVGPIPVDDEIGKEIIYRISVDDLDNKSQFQTDSNGRQMMPRVRDQRPAFEIEGKEPVSQNYYPVNAKISMVDQSGSGRLTILNDRSQAGGSIKDGEMELLLHRRLMDDDDFGVNETLSEEAFGTGLVARGKQYLLFDDDETVASARHRALGLQIFGSPLLFFKEGDLTSEDVAAQRSLFPNLDQALPDNVHLLTLEPDLLNPGVLLVRLEHIFDQNEDPELSKPQIVNLKGLLSSLGDVTSAEELVLGANEPRSDNQEHRLRWKTISTPPKRMASRQDDPENFEYELKAMDIRTFAIKITPTTSSTTTTPAPVPENASNQLSSLLSGIALVLGSGFFALMNGSMVI